MNPQRLVAAGLAAGFVLFMLTVQGSGAAGEPAPGDTPGAAGETAQGDTPGAAGETAQGDTSPASPWPLAGVTAEHLTNMANGNAISDVLDPLLDDMNPKVNIPGFAGVVVDEPNNHFTLYWKGPLPANAAALANLPNGMTATVLPALHDRGELEAEMRAIVAYDNAHVAPADRVTGLSPNVDGSGITATVASAAALNSPAVAWRANHLVIATTISPGAVPLTGT
ncbi:MAG TPA: hypothetical protein VH496_09915 [Mycobacterium sp.]|jgi:hypothetical protein